jgi:uncharacterized protein (DUF2147 family)
MERTAGKTDASRFAGSFGRIRLKFGLLFKSYARVVQPPLCRITFWAAEARIGCQEILMTTGIGKRRITPLLAAVLLSMAGIGAAQASSVDGTWIIRDLVLHIFDCEQSVCGRIVWLKDERRRSSQCGKTIIWGLEAKGPTDWAGGSILDPNNGKTYQLSATYEPDGTLRARIFKGIPLLGKTEILKRIDVQELVGRC